MESARARLGASRRGLIGRQKKSGVMEGILGTVGAVTAFAGTQVKKAKTAWGEYEAGMEAKFGQEGKLAAGLEHESRKAGGRGLVGIGRRALQTLIPGGDKGWFQGPTGEVRIGGSMYDREKIQKAGSFLGSDASAMLDKGARTKYLERTVGPGTKAPGSIEGFDYSSLKGSGLTPAQYDVKVAEASKDAIRAGQRERVSRPESEFTTQMPTDTSYEFGEGGGMSVEAQKKYAQEQQQSAASFLTGEQSLWGGGGVDPAQGSQVNVSSAQNQQIYTKPAKDPYQYAMQPEVTVNPGLSLEQQWEDAESDYDKNKIATQIREQNRKKGRYYDMESDEVKTRRKQPSFFPYSSEMGGSDPGSYNYGGSYAKGGNFVTNGPQKILVGDNPGGRERVTIKPLPPKNDKGKFGRHGDDRMKVIDGELAHISPIEESMSPEDIKKYGAGTINPITGKKEYFLGAIATGLSIGSSLMKGFSAMGNKADVQAGQTAAYDIYQDQLGLLGAKKGVAQDAAESQFTGAQRDVTMGTQIATRDIETSADLSRSQSNLATSGTIEEKVQTQTDDVMAKYKSDMTKLFETRDLSKAEADLSYRSGQMSAEESYQNTLTGLESTPTTFLEGVFG